MVMKQIMVVLTLSLFLSANIAFAAVNANSKIGCSLKSGTWTGSYHVFGQKRGVVVATIHVDGKGHLYGKYTAGSDPAEAIYGNCGGGSIILNGGRLSGKYAQNQIYLSNYLVNVELSKV